MKLFFLTLSTVFISADLFVWWRGSRMLKRCDAGLGPRIFFHLFLAFQTLTFAAIFLSRSQGWFLDGLLPSAVMVAIFIWHPIALPILLILHLLGLLKEGVSALIRWISPKKATPPVPPEEQGEKTVGEVIAQAAADQAEEHLQLTRRQFLGTAAALSPPLVTLMLTAVAEQQLSEFRVREITVRLPQLPKELDGMTIAHLTDTHVGRFSHGRVLKKIADATNALKPDFVAFTGDLMNDSLEWLPQATEMLESIDQPVYLCEGNHDRIADKKRFWKTMRETPNVEFLMQQEKTVDFRGERVQFLGSAWDRSVDPALTAEMMRLKDPFAFSVHLVHHPHIWDHPHDFPLTLAGHTHGGQLMVNERIGFGPKMYRYWSGLYERQTAKGDQALIVSNGAGNWFPLRTNAPAEIVHITLRRA